ncbi:SDR family oxidoreductase [Alteromonadaceae bacterium M269]|nr:SDR family oxidoreductase [Alteromonadaceae bacterium M269]
MQVQNKVVWVTGASSGIGKALITELAKQGAHLILSSRNEEQLQALKNELPNSDKHQVLALDLSQPNELDSKLGALGEQPVDILINNGGISQRGLARDIELKVHRDVMEINYFGTIQLTQLALPKLLKSQGMVVNIASVAGKVGGQSMSGYAASKHALIGYMDCLRAEEAQNGLRVLNVCPGFVQTQISVNALTADGKAFGDMADSIAQGITAEECAQAVINAIKAEKKEITVGKGLSRWAPLIKRISPNLLHNVAAKKNIR